MIELDDLIADIRPRITEIATHVEQLPTADEVPDATYAKVLNFLQRTMQKTFQLLDDDDISRSEMMLLHDIRGTVASIFACSEIINEQCADQLNAEQKELVGAIESICEELLNLFASLTDQYVSPFDANDHL